MDELYTEQEVMEFWGSIKSGYVSYADISRAMKEEQDLKVEFR